MRNKDKKKKKKRDEENSEGMWSKKERKMGGRGYNDCELHDYIQEQSLSMMRGIKQVMKRKQKEKKRLNSLQMLVLHGRLGDAILGENTMDSPAMHLVWWCRGDGARRSRVADGAFADSRRGCCSR